MNNYKHWQVDIDNQKVIWLGINRENATANTINEEVLDNLNTILIDIAQQKELKGLIIYSVKEKGFIAGADVKIFTTFTQASQAVDFLRKGHAVFNALEALSIPTVALIDGFCMGGGLELALACSYRVASDESDTRLGLPEIMLGIHPGWGGTVRLPRLIGGFNALSKMILTGAPVIARKAKQLGVVDDVVPVRQLKRAALYYIQHKPLRHKPTLMQSLTNKTLFRMLLAPLMRKNVAKRVNQDYYPAPYAVINQWEQYGVYGDRPLIKEIDSVEQLIQCSDTSNNLIRAFLLRERMKSFAKNSQFYAHHVHVIGAGLMGGDIAAWCALKGLTVTLQDKTYEQMGAAIKRAHTLFAKKLKQKRLIQAAMDRLIVDLPGQGIAQADVIIEAVFENLEVKQTIMREVEAKAKPSALIATNTSSIPLEEISTVMQSPARLVGIHYFNPVAKMELVEVVSSQFTSPEIAEQAYSFVAQISRLPLPVRSSPGFLINRILMPYLMECVQLLEEGYSAELIDKAAQKFGMFMGPVELADTVGMDVCLAVAENLTQHFGGTIPDKLREMVSQKKLGRKTGEGFYKYKSGKAIKKKLPEDLPTQDIADRLILRIIKESWACLQEKVVADSDLLDGGMIFATGFAPFRGGPIHYAEHYGKERMQLLFNKLEVQHGDRFKLESFIK